MPVEEILRRELREVANGLSVPALPPLPEQPPRSQRWRPLLVAAAAMLIVAGAIAVMVANRDGGEPTPAPPGPDHTEINTVRSLTADAPTVPYVFDGTLYVDGEEVAGTWWEVSHAGDAWAAQSDDIGWRWGTDAEAHEISGDVVLHPHLSPDGTLLAVATTQDGGRVLLIDTRSGKPVNTLRIDLTGPANPNALGVVAVTDDAKVFLGRGTRRLMWLAADGDKTVDLDTTAPDQWVQGSTPAGLIVLDGTTNDEREAIYLAEVSDTGRLNRVRTLPDVDVPVNPSGTWLAYGGYWGGESETTSEITAEPVDGSGELTLPPPDDRQLLAKAWEDDDLLLAELHSDGIPTGLARCSIRAERCVVIEAQ